MSASETMPSQGTSTFELFALRFHFTAQQAVHFPPGRTADLFRGQFGKILYRRDPAAYSRFFAPVAKSGPSGLKNPPRAFVLRVRHLDGATLDRFHVGLNVFETNQCDVRGIRDTIARLGQESLRADLIRTDGLELLHLPTLSARAAHKLRVQFLTPTELKDASRPEFEPLFARIRDRISTLRSLYGSGPLAIDFKAMGERANAISMTRCDIRHVDVERVSRGKRHPLGGFVGFAEYAGDLTEFVPYFEIACYTGIGRQTVWGKGEICFETF
jgi:hypothetical protein